jgi:hypothetical protein
MIVRLDESEFVRLRRPAPPDLSREIGVEARGLSCAGPGFLILSTPSHG